MSNITKLAKHLKAKDNPSLYTPMFGKIISLPELKIRLGTRVLLTKEDIKTTFDIKACCRVTRTAVLVLQTSF